MKPIKECNILVTGGLGGLGKAIVEEFNNLGANTIVTTSNKDNLNHDNSFYWDMRDSSSTIELLNELKAKGIHIDIFIHCAHLFTPAKLLFQLDPDELMDSLIDNTKEVFRLSKTLVKKMNRKKEGRVIFIGSLISQKPHRGKASYILEKNTLTGLVRAIHGDFYENGVLASILHPALIETDQIKEKLKDQKLDSPINTSSLLRPEEVAQEVVRIATLAKKEHEVVFEMRGNQKWW